VLDGALRPDGGGIYDLIGSDGQPDGMMGEFTRVIHVRVP